MSKRVNPRIFTVIVVGVLVLAGAGAYFALYRASDNEQNTAGESSTITSRSNTIETKTQSAVASNSTEDLLLYLIEEEKLAHDVYTVMYQKYGANVFGNILQSESTHQGKVLTLLQARNIMDPRSAEVGMFKNQELQAFYDRLIEQGNKNATEAYKAGVAIEEKDIADISSQLATATDDDVITALVSLRDGSESHLRAFNRQL